MANAKYANAPVFLPVIPKSVTINFCSAKIVLKIINVTKLSKAKIGNRLSLNNALLITKRINPKQAPAPVVRISNFIGLNGSNVINGVIAKDVKINAAITSLDSRSSVVALITILY